MGYVSGLRCNPRGFTHKLFGKTCSGELLSFADPIQGDLIAVLDLSGELCPTKI